jgi:hypothetical protein
VQTEARSSGTAIAEKVQRVSRDQQGFMCGAKAV